MSDEWEATNQLRLVQSVTGKENVYYMGECSGSKDVTERVLQQRRRKPIYTGRSEDYMPPRPTSYDYEWRPVPTIKQES